MCFKALPWQPTPCFTGISDYTINDQARVVRQVDFWDSINLVDGEDNAAVVAAFAAMMVAVRTKLTVNIGKVVPTAPLTCIKLFYRNDRLLLVLLVFVLLLLLSSHFAHHYSMFLVHGHKTGSNHSGVE